MSKTFISSKTRQQIEDFAGRTFMLLWFMLASGRHLVTIVNHASQRGLTPSWLLDTTHSFLLLVFSALAVVLTILRQPTRVVAQGLEPRISAILGSFLILSLPFLPATEVNVEVKLASVMVTTVGITLSIYCLLWLGRSYSIMATARALVTGGPYGVVRHPLYASELIAIAGVVLGSISIPAVVLFLITLGFILRRTYNEERVLRAAFPEYEEYAQRVPRIIPRIHLFKPGTVTKHPAAFTSRP